MGSKHAKQSLRADQLPSSNQLAATYREYPEVAGCACGKASDSPTPAVVVELNGIIVGALTGAQLNSLVNCLQNGYTYEATVVAIAGGNCTVQVCAT
jgi:hypothetical protein